MAIAVSRSSIMATSARVAVSSARVSIPIAPCADRRQELVGFEDGGCRREEPKPLQAGDGKQRGVHFPGFELAQPRLDIAAQRHDRKVRPQPLDKGLPPRRRGADHRARRQVA